jgi:hypothetical protein
LTRTGCAIRMRNPLAYFSCTFWNIMVAPSF